MSSAKDSFGEADRTEVTRVWEEALSREGVSSGSTIRSPDAASPAATGVFLRPHKVTDGSGLPREPAEYELLELVGEGGLGLVYSARQASLDRAIAVKMLRQERAGREAARNRLMAEAVVTGGLDHPNIVPVHELGTNEAGDVFYAMKLVRGTPWEELIDRKGVAENLEVLQKVCDAVAFAHSRGIVHRDLKPGNIMLGEFGEVMVMDWGLAVAYRGEGRAASRERSPAAGTPAYMAPEAARGSTELIGPRTDIYLLGGLLYRIVTGLVPHGGETAEECLLRAAENRIQPTGVKGELVAIALKAMASDPGERHRDVREFQDEIRSYQAHAESLGLTELATQRLHRAEETSAYEDYSRAVFGFTDALNLWEGNEKARKGLSGSRLAYARAAYRRGDYDLAESLLDPADPAHSGLREEVAGAAAEQRRRKKALKVFRLLAAGVGGAFVISLLAAYLLVSREQRRTESARVAAEESRAAAETERDRAVTAEREAHQQEQAALAEKLSAERRLAASLVAEGDALAASGSWGEARGLYREALEVIDRIADGSEFADFRLWESYRKSPEELLTLKDFSRRVVSLCFSPDDRYVLSGCWDGEISLWDLASGTRLRMLSGHESRVFAVAFSRDGLLAYSLGADGTLRQWDTATGFQLKSDLISDPASITAGAFSPDLRFAAVTDRTHTITIWDLAAGKQLRSMNHQVKSEWEIRDMIFSPDSRRLATSIFGTYWIWDVESGEIIRSWQGGQPLVYSKAFSPDGRRLISGDRVFQVKLWDLNDYSERWSRFAHNRSVSALDFIPSADLPAAVSGGEYGDGVIKVWDVNEGREVVSLSGHGPSGIYSIKSSNHGTLFASGGRRGDVKLWELDPGLRPTLEGVDFSGHTGVVTDIAVSPAGDLILTGSGDGTVKLWDRETGCLLKSLPRSGSAAIGFDASGRPLLSRIFGAGLELVDVVTGVPVRRLPGEPGRVPSACRISRDGERLWILSRGGILICRNIESGEIIHRTKVKGSIWWTSRPPVGISLYGPLALTDDPDLAASSPDFSFADPEIFNRKRYFHGQYTVGVSPSGSPIYTGQWHGQIELWPSDGIAPRRLSRRDRAPHSELIDSISVSPDGRLLVSYSAKNNQLVLWDLESRRDIYAYYDFDTPRYQLAYAEDREQLRRIAPDDIRGVAFAPDGKSLFVFYWNGRFQLWDIKRTRQYRSFYLSVPGAQAALSRDPLDPGARKVMGEWFAFRGQWGRAIENLEIARARGAEVSPLLLARCYWQYGDTAGAERYLLDALREGEAAEGYVDICLLAIRQRSSGDGEIRGASAPGIDAVDSLDGKSEEPGDLIALGRFYARFDHWHKALELFSRARSKGSDPPALAMAGSYWRKGRLDKAETWMEAARTAGEAPDEYIELCLAAIRAEAVDGLTERAITDVLPEVVDIEDEEALRAAFGGFAILEGEVAWVSRGRGQRPSRIVFKTGTDRYFSGIIFGEDIEAFDGVFGGDIVSAFQGARLRMSGNILRFRGYLQMKLVEPEQVLVVREAETVTETSAAENIDISQVKNLSHLLGREITVEGRVAWAAWSPTGRVMNIYFQGGEDSLFQTVVFQRDRLRIDRAFGGDFRSAIAGAVLLVRGRLEEFQGMPQISISRPEQVTVIAGSLEPPDGLDSPGLIEASDRAAVYAAVGKTATVRGKVESVSVESWPIRIRLEGNEKFEGVIFPDAVSDLRDRFGQDLARALNGAELSLSGTISLHRYVPQIVIRESAQLILRD